MNTSAKVKKYFIFKNKGRNSYKQTFNSEGYRICNVDGCVKIHKAKGFCDKHYQQVRIHKSVTTYNEILSLPNEIWRSVNNYEGLYEVSNLGRIKSLDKYVPGKSDSLSFFTGRILKSNKVGSGYLISSLFKNKKIAQFASHVIVAKAFIPNPKYKPQVNHIDRDKENNNINNLEWVTARENTCHYVKSITTKSKYVGVTFHKPTGKWRARITINKKRLSLGLFINELDASKAVDREAVNI